MKLLLPHCAALALAAASLAFVPPPHGGVYRGPGAGVGPGGGAPGAGTPGGGSGTYSDWSTWWSFNRDPYLRLKEAIHRQGPATGSGDFPLGAGQQPRELASSRPSEEELSEQVVPALIRALRDSDDPDLVTGCLVALAKIGVEPVDEDMPRLEPLLASHLTSKSQEIVETAAVSLGVLGRESVAPLLASLMQDNKAGRDRQGGGRVPDRTRALAAYGLGLVGTRSAREDARRFAVHHLGGALLEDDTSGRDLPTACVLSLGLVGLEPGDAYEEIEDAVEHPPTTREQQIAWMLEWFSNRRIDAAVRAHGAVALARLCQGADPQAKVAVATVFLHALREHSDAPTAIQRAVVQALGLLGDDDGDAVDGWIRAGLLRVAKDRDALVRDMARISLARVGARPGTGEDAGSGEVEVRGFLLRDLARGRTGTRSWSALSLGVMEFHRLETGRAPSVDVRIALRDALNQRKSPVDAGAIVVALGLAGDLASAEALRELLMGGGAEGVRAFSAVALGMMGDTDSIESLRELVRSSTYRPGLQREAGIALALLGDRELVPELARGLGEAKTLASQRSIGIVLGYVGDRRAIPPLLEVLENESAMERTRAFAAAALGIVGDKELFPWNSKLALDVYYGEPPPTLTDPLGARGILDLL